MDIANLEKERNKVQRKIEILNGITCFEFSTDISLVAEMKKEYNEQLSAICEEENRIQYKNEQKIKMALIIYKMLLFGGGIVSLFLFCILIGRESDIILKNDIYMSLLITYNVIFYIFNVVVIMERKSKYVIAIILLVPCIAIISKRFWGYDVFHAVNEVSITFAFSLYSFISSLIKDLKKWNKK